jgi:peptide chain release factor subunit 1
MFSKKDLRDLEKDKSLRAPVASIYFNLDKKTPEGQHYLAELRRQLSIVNKQILTRYKKPDLLQESLQQEIVPKILTFIDEKVLVNPNTRAIAVFASLLKTSGTNNQRMVFCALPRPVRSQAHVEETAFVRPLMFLLDQYEPYAVITANRHVASFFMVSMGEIHERKEFLSDIPKRHDEGGWSQKRFERKIESMVEKHVQRVAQFAVKRLKENDTRRIVLGGDDNIVHLLKSNLPERELKMVIGTIPSNPHESINETLERTLEIASEAEKASEKTAVQELRDALAHIGNAVSGIEETLNAVNDKNVAKLLLYNDFHIEGSLCNNCQMLFTPITQCPNCDVQTKHLDDLAEEIAERVFDEKGEVEFVIDSIDLEALGKIGAILRYDSNK